MDRKRIIEYVAFLDDIKKRIRSKGKDVHSLVIETLEELLGETKTLDLRDWGIETNGNDMPYLTAYDKYGSCGYGPIVNIKLTESSIGKDYHVYISADYEDLYVDSVDIDTMQEIRLLEMLLKIKDDKDWHIEDGVLVPNEK